MLYKLADAMVFASKGQIEEWVHLFLLGEGNNIEFSDGLKIEKRYFYGPVKMPLFNFNRCCGPENTNRFIIDENWFNKNVTAIKERFENGWDMPPLIINFANGKFELNDGNHRFEALIRANITDYYVIIWTTKKIDMDEFMKKYGEKLA